MDEKTQWTLPFRFLEGRAYREQEWRKAPSFGGFSLLGEVGGFSWKQQKIGSIQSDVILFPRSAFYRGNQYYRGDIMWLWKHLAGYAGKPIIVGYKGVLSLLLSNDPKLYTPRNEFTTGSQECITLMWNWTKYICSLSWWKQKMGRERKIFEDCKTEEQMLHRLSTLEISNE